MRGLLPNNSTYSLGSLIIAPYLTKDAVRADIPFPDARSQKAKLALFHLRNASSVHERVISLGLARTIQRACTLMEGLANYAVKMIILRRIALHESQVCTTTVLCKERPDASQFSL